MGTEHCHPVIGHAWTFLAGPPGIILMTSADPKRLKGVLKLHLQVKTLMRFSDWIYIQFNRWPELNF